MTDAERLRMRCLALGRLQVAAAIRIDVEDTVVMAIRGARGLGATWRELEIESGLSAATVRRVARGGLL